MENPTWLLPALLPLHQPKPPGDLGRNRRGGQLQKQSHQATLAPGSHFVGASTLPHRKAFQLQTAAPCSCLQAVELHREGGGCFLALAGERAAGRPPWAQSSQGLDKEGSRAQGDPREGAPSLAKSYFQGGCMKSERPLHGEGQAWAPDVCREPSDSCSLALEQTCKRLEGPCSGPGPTSPPSPDTAPRPQLGGLNQRSAPSRRAKRACC